MWSPKTSAAHQLSFRRHQRSWSPKSRTHSFLKTAVPPQPACEAVPVGPTAAAPILLLNRRPKTAQRSAASPDMDARSHNAQTHFAAEDAAAPENQAASPLPKAPL